MLKKVVLLAAALVLVTAGTAAAQDYPPAGDTVTVSDTTVEPGQSITLSARTFQAGSTVTFTLFSAPVVLGTATANSSGVATITATIPANTAPGTHTIEATGVDEAGNPLTVTTTITVLGGAADLPTTGSASTTPMTQVALAVLAGGGLLVLLANRRRTTKTEVRETAGV